MSISTAEELGRIYDSSVLPAAVSSAKGIVYANPAFEKRFDKNSAEFSSLHTGNSYERIVFLENKPYKLYVTPINDSESLVNIFEGSVFEDYSEVLCAAVRHAASSVCSAADRLSASCGTDEQTALLNTIDGAMLTLISEFFIPEELNVLRSCKPSDFEAVSVSAAINDLSDELSEVLSRHTVTVRSRVPAGLYAAVDMRAIKLLLMDYAVRNMEGERMVEAISLSLLRHRADGMLLTISCGHITDLPSNLDSRALSRPEGYSPSKELESLICSKFGCTTKYLDKPEYCSLSVDIPMVDAPFTNYLRCPVARYGSRNRFSEGNAYLSRFGVNPRYEPHNGNK